jgi:acylphosphatase
MIARKITYIGHFNQEALAIMYDITRKTEITGQVQALGDNQIELNLEGDASMIKLIQHQIERRVKSFIKDKTVTPIPYHNYIGVTLLN